MNDQKSLLNENSTDLTSKNNLDETFNENLIKDLSSFVEGQIIEGTVVAVASDSVFVDIGYKSEGEILKSEFESLPVKGDKFKVMIIKTEGRDGKLIISKRKADEISKWDNINRSYKDGLPIEGKITEVIKGGFTVDIDGFKAFLPISQVSKDMFDNQKSYLNKNLSFKIYKINGKSNIVLSYRRYLEELKEKNIKNFFDSKKEGDTVEGIVKDIVSYGAFVDLGSIDGLLHLNNISWARVVDPEKYIKKGDRLKCKILSLDRNNRKVALGLKQMVADPWDTFEQRYEKGKRYRGKVTKLMDFGVFVELEEGIEGLVHISDLSWTRRINHPKELIKVEDIVEVMVLDYNLIKKTISLGLKQVFPNPWDDIDIRYPVGTKINTKVKKITKFGVFLEIEEGIDGLLHVNDISWTKNFKNPSQMFKKGDNLEVMVLLIDKENNKIQLGLKQLKENPWGIIKSKNPKWSVVSGVITKITEFGAFVKIDNDIEGLIHTSQLTNEKVENPISLYKVGDEIKAIVLDIDEEKKKLTLSIKEYLNRLAKEEMMKYMNTSKETKTDSIVLGDLIDLSKIGK